MAHEIYTAVVMDAALFDMEMLWLYNCSWKSLEINFREILLSNIKSIGYCLLKLVVMAFCKLSCTAIHKTYCFILSPPQRKRKFDKEKEIKFFVIVLCLYHCAIDAVCCYDTVCL